MPAGDETDLSLGARLVRAILSDERLSNRLGGLAAEAAAAAAAEAGLPPPEPRACDAGGGGPEQLLPEALLINIFGYLDTHDVGRLARVGGRWRAAAVSEALWRRLCRRQLAHFHPPGGPLASLPLSLPLPLSDAADVVAADDDSAGDAADGAFAATSGAAASASASFFILPPPPEAAAAEAALVPAARAAAASAAGASAARARPLRAPWHMDDDADGVSSLGPAARAERAAVQQLLLRAAAEQHAWAGSPSSARAAYLGARADLVSGFKAAAAAARSFRHAFACLPGVRLGGFYQQRHQYIRSGIEDRFHRTDGLLLVVYYRALRFFADGTCVYVMTCGRLLDVARPLLRGRGAGARRQRRLRAL